MPRQSAYRNQRDSVHRSPFAETDCFAGNGQPFLYDFMTSLSPLFYGECVMVVDNQLDDHFSQSLLNVFMNASGDCSIKSIAFEGNPFSEEVLEHMKCIYGGDQ